MIARQKKGLSSAIIATLRPEVVDGKIVATITPDKQKIIFSEQPSGTYSDSSDCEG